MGIISLLRGRCAGILVADKLTGRLRRALGWILEHISAAPMRIVPLLSTTRQRLIVYTDATGEGSVGFVAATGASRSWGAPRVPQHIAKKLRARITQIAPYELLAAVYAAATVGALHTGVEMMVFVDNSNAESWLRKGYTRHSDL